MKSQSKLVVVSPINLPLGPDVGFVGGPVTGGLLALIGGVAAWSCLFPFVVLAARDVGSGDGYVSMAPRCKAFDQRGRVQYFPLAVLCVESYLLAFSWWFHIIPYVILRNLMISL